MNSAGSSWPLANLFLLAGAASSIMVTGTEDAWAIAVFLLFAGSALLFVRPLARPSAFPLVLIPLFCCLCLFAFLPQSFFPIPGWRRVLADLGTIPLAESVSPQPWLGWFWWWLLAGTCFIFLALLAAPLETKQLAVVLHAAAAFVAIYASLSIFAFQTSWKYPFHGGAVFGFLPNRNHTATLLVVGAVLSFGLMQWRLARGNKASAAFAALCGAPSLAALLFFSTSRAGVVFLVIGLVIWAAGAARSSSIRRRIVAAIAVLAVFLGLLFVLGGSTVRDRLGDLWKQTLAAQTEDGVRDVDFRQPVFRDTVRMIGEQPLVGAGIGQFADVFKQYRKESAREAAVLHPESDWLMVAAETGLPSVVVLLLLAVWYVAVCWKSRSFSGGMLRWTAASAVAVAALHGFIDVPWHRASLGWFVSVIAVSSVPASGHPARTPLFSRFAFVVGALALMAFAGWIGYEKSKGRSPGFYRWPEISADLQRLGRERRFDEAEKAAQHAVRQFPLNSEAYYWLAGYLGTFQGTEEEIHAAVRAGRAVEPALARVPAEQAVMLQSIDADAALEAWRVAIERAAVIDAKDQRKALPSAGENTRKSLVMFKDDTPRQLALVRSLQAQRVLVAHWIVHANADAVDVFLREVPDVSGFVDSLPPEQRRQVLARWIALPDAARAVGFMEDREALSAKGEYWPVLARYYAAQGDLSRAVRRVASSCGIPLEAPREGVEGLRGEMAALITQGNTVAARRLAKDAVDAAKPESDDLSAALAYYASQGDWPSAWRAASRLATEAKIGQ